MNGELDTLTKTHKIEIIEETIKIYLNIPTIKNPRILLTNKYKLTTYSPPSLTIPPFNNSLTDFISEIELRNTENKKMYKIEGLELPPILNIEGNIDYAVDKRGIGFLILKKPNLEISCASCSKRDTINETQLCKKCNKQLTYEFLPKYEKTFGLLNFNFHIISFLKSTYQFNCLNCGELYESTIDTELKEKCFRCFNILYIKIIFIRVRTEKENIKIILGRPLPEKGTCKHYKKSFRWFKFQCCNRVFPCDDCHNENSNHLNEKANKMICGFCSKEQSCKESCSCGMSLKSNKEFWNAGKGMRDKVKLNKKDSKKYKK
ncbi:hypothetical protein CDIK_0905 [Cucumispora dikerogammari]|nr:hypothetical protein CDIK_0905 [Cucumispora dikerogammari]